MTTSKSSKPKPPKRGRPPVVGDVPARRVNVTLDQTTVDRASDLGSGNLSAGLRMAVAHITGRKA